MIEEKEDGTKATTGNVTEIGLINYLVNCGINAEAKLKEKKDNVEILFQVPFSSKRKR
jgi:magnesium-transporting ATPase (P-type)